MRVSGVGASTYGLTEESRKVMRAYTETGTVIIESYFGGKVTGLGSPFGFGTEGRGSYHVTMKFKSGDQGVVGAITERREYSRRT